MSRTATRPRGAQIPHAILLYGNVYNIRWYNPEKNDNEEGWVKHQLGELNFEEHTIRISAALRYDLQLAWETLIHEVLHVADRFESEWRREHEALTRTDRSAKTRWRKLESSDHNKTGAKGDVINRLDMMLGRMLADNQAWFACACPTCYKNRLRRQRDGKE